MDSLESEICVDSQPPESSQLLTPVDITSVVPPTIIPVICGSASHGGKAKSKNWRKLFIVADSNVQLGAFLQSIGSSGSETLTPPAPSCVGSPSARPKHSQSGSLVDPVLAFTKVYRLRGDSAGLK